MKINWGTAIVIAFVAFIGFILYFVITATTSEKYEHELVSEEYYKDELDYQTEIDLLKNFQDLGLNLSILRTKMGLEIRFPNSYLEKDLKGILSLYRPSNQSLDFDSAVVISRHSSLLIPDNKLVDGRWDIKLYWTKNNKNYLFKKEIVY